MSADETRDSKKQYVINPDDYLQRSTSNSGARVRLDTWPGQKPASTPESGGTQGATSGPPKDKQKPK